MSRNSESLHVPLPPALPGETTYFNLTGKPFEAFVRISTDHGTVIDVPVAQHGQVTIVCGADRSALEVELIFPDSELIDAKLTRVDAPNRSKRRGKA